jgi:hypothetical protein
MKHILLICGPKSTWASLSQEEMEKVYAGHRAYGEEMTKAGVMRGGSELNPISDATSIRFSREGKTTVVDGPFAETKEQLAGYYLIEAENLDQALC